MMLVIGLTGSIGMGKTTAAAQFARRGVPVFDADAEVHRLYARKAVPAIEAAFPKAVRAGRVDRAALAKEISGSPEKLKTLEAIVHPMVKKAEIDFLQEAEAKGAAFAVLEIPLLFETDAHKRVDVTVVVSAPEHVQRARVLAREGMSEERLLHLLKRQLPDAEKRARADYVVDSGTTLDKMQGQVDRILDSLRGREGRVMERLRKL
jgi:dephospho-CoA kinase